MTRKNSVLFGLIILLIMTAIAILGCKSNVGNTITDNAIAANTATVNTVAYDGTSFPLSFRGTWKKDNFNHKLTFTQNTLSASNQTYTWNFQSVSGDIYTIKVSNYNYTGKITIKNNNGYLEISGDSAPSYENNWNGIWKKQ